MDTELIKKIETQYPYPIAATFRRVRTIDPDDIINIHDSFGDLFEIIIKYLAVISLQDFKTNYQLPNYFDDFLKKMLHPSLGHWNEVIRMVTSEENSKCRIASKVANFYKSKINPELRKDCDSIQSILGSKLPLKTYKDVFDLFILYRNKSKGHGAKISKEEYKDRLKAIENIRAIILIELDFLKNFMLFYVDEINVLPTSEFRHKCKIFTGTQVEPKSLVRKNSLLPNHLYLEENGNEDSILIDIYPLLSSYNCKECKSDQIFVFNDYRNGRLEYLSYTCGHFFYPEMLPGEFEKIFKVTLTQITSDEDRDSVKAEDNQEKAWQLNSMALKKMANKDYYEALEYLQLSISFQSTWESNYYSALLTMITGGTPTEIVFYLNTCEQLEPDNEKSLELKKKFNEILSSEEDFRMPSSEQIKKLVYLASCVLEDEVYIPKVKPIYFYLTPPKFRNIYNILWIFIPVIYFLVAGLTREFIGIEQNYFVQGMKILMIISFILIINYITMSLPDLYFSFLQLVPEKSKNGFKKWFNHEIEKTFGDFKEEKTIRESLNLKNKNAKNYLLIFFILYPIATLGAIYLTCFDNFFTLNTIFVAIDYSVMWMVMVLGVPVMINTFKMLRNFSHFPLKPIIGALNLLSLQKIGRIIFNVSIPWTFDYFALTIIGFITFSSNVILVQLLCFYFMVGLGCVWTLITPYYFTNSLTKSKDKILSKYSEHLENSFDRLVDNPNQENLDRYHWLKAQQKEFLNIKTSPIASSIRIGIILINTFIILTSLLYPFLKFKISFQDIINWFNITFIH